MLNIELKIFSITHNLYLLLIFFLGCPLNTSAFFNGYLSTRVASGFMLGKLDYNKKTSTLETKTLDFHLDYLSKINSKFSLGIGLSHQYSSAFYKPKDKYFKGAFSASGANLDLYYSFLENVSIGLETSYLFHNVLALKNLENKEINGTFFKKSEILSYKGNQGFLARIVLIKKLILDPNRP